MRRGIVGKHFREGAEPTTDIRCSCGKVIRTIEAHETVLHRSTAGSLEQITCSSCGKVSKVRVGSQH